jgi:hypothetical protein
MCGNIDVVCGPVSRGVNPMPSLQVEINEMRPPIIRRPHAVMKFGPTKEAEKASGSEADQVDHAF